MREPAADRRAHNRHELLCPLVVLDARGRELARTQTLNISDGGALVGLPINQFIPVGQQVRLKFKVPRATPNTYMLEEFAAAAKVVRHRRGRDNPDGELALMFIEPVGLELEV